MMVHGGSGLRQWVYTYTCSVVCILTGVRMSVKGPSDGGVRYARGRRRGSGRPARTRNPQGQGARLRADLIAAADGILARTGDVEALSLRAVAREVGIATPSIYLHFPDKSALIHAVLERALRGAGRRGPGGGHGGDGTSREASGRLPGVLPVRHRAPERLSRAVRAALSDRDTPSPLPSATMGPLPTA